MALYVSSTLTYDKSFLIGTAKSGHNSKYERTFRFVPHRILQTLRPRTVYSPPIFKLTACGSGCGCAHRLLNSFTLVKERLINATSRDARQQSRSESQSNHQQFIMMQSTNAPFMRRRGRSTQWRHLSTNELRQPHNALFSLNKTTNFQNTQITLFHKSDTEIPITA